MIERIQKVFKACAYFHNRILRHNSRDVFGTVDDHFDILRNVDAESLQRFADENDWLNGRVYQMAAQANNLEGNLRHRQRQNDTDTKAQNTKIQKTFQNTERSKQLFFLYISYDHFLN